MTEIFYRWVGFQHPLRSLYGCLYSLKQISVHLCGETAEEVWNLCNEKLQQPEFSARGLIKQSNVTLVCTTDDPVDTLEWHKKIKADDSFDVQVVPAWRPEKAMGINTEDISRHLHFLVVSIDSPPHSSGTRITNELSRLMHYL